MGGQVGLVAQQREEAIWSNHLTTFEFRRARLQVLNPGAGLGRLACEIAGMGESCQESVKRPGEPSLAELQLGPFNRVCLSGQ